MAATLHLIMTLTNFTSNSFFDVHRGTHFRLSSSARPSVPRQLRLLSRET